MAKREKNHNLARPDHYEANIGAHKFKKGEERAKECGSKGGIQSGKNRKARPQGFCC